MTETVVVVTPCDRGWGALVILGLISILFGILLMLFPDLTAIAVVTLIGVLVVIFGVIMLLSSLFLPAGAPKSALLLFGGLVGILIGVGIVVYPIIAGAILTEIIGAAIFIIGMMQMLFGLVFEGDKRRSLYFIAGLLSVIFALLIIFYPLTGGLILFGYLVAIYFFILGLFMAIAGYLSHCICTQYANS
ncbi:MAG: DUF308 domain-containing protein [Methanolinea sp.]|jgi:uncharacterized membrane protein HdeD (DUF308 family)|nr:DUF308 domain-containing protein [Methanolinea sp.]